MSSFDKIAATAASMRVSLAAAGVTVASHRSSLSSSEVFKGSLQQRPPGFVTTRRNVIVYGICMNFWADCKLFQLEVGKMDERVKICSDQAVVEV